MPILYPLKLHPIYKEFIWGGLKLKESLGKDYETSKKIGESWEISDHDDDVSIISNGEYAGKTLRWLMKNHGRELFGNHEYRKFPLLYKFIGPNDDLSVQVHPDDEYANKYKPGEYGKTEAWYVMYAEPGAKLIAGLKDGTTKEVFKKAVNEGAIEKCMHELEVKKGDLIFLPSGRIHALMKNIVINEIQQNSDTTFRLYDWGRLGFDSKPRPTHIKEAMDVINFDDYEPKPAKKEWIDEGNNRHAGLVDCEFFFIEEHEIKEEKAINCEGNFKAISGIEGSFKLKCGDFTLDCKKGESVLVPAVCKEFTVVPAESVTILISGARS